MEVEVGRLEVRSIGVGVNGIGWRKVLVRQNSDIQEPSQIDGTSLEILEDGILIGHDQEHDLIEVRSPWEAR